MSALKPRDRKPARRSSQPHLTGTHVVWALLILSGLALAVLLKTGDVTQALPVLALLIAFVTGTYRGRKS